MAKVKCKSHGSIKGIRHTGALSLRQSMTTLHLPVDSAPRHAQNRPQIFFFCPKIWPDANYPISLHPQNPHQEDWTCSSVG